MAEGSRQVGTGRQQGGSANQAQAVVFNGRGHLPAVDVP